MAPFGLSLSEIQRRATVAQGNGRIIARSTITKVLNGSRRGSLRMTVILAQALGITMDEMVELLKKRQGGLR